MGDFLVVDPTLCTGCRQCELACSYEHEGLYSPSLSRIRLVRFEHNSLSVPVACAYCERPLCEEVCPTGAMSHEPGKRYAVVLDEKCMGCKECVHACPLGVVQMHPAKGVAMRCDLCKGDPACVKACPTGAIKYEPLELALQEKRRARVAGLNLG